MLVSKTLSLYIFNNYLKALLYILGAISICILFVNMFDILNKIRNVIVPFFTILNMSFLRIPFLLSELLPLGLMISSLCFFDSFAKKNEITIIFGSSVSIWKFLLPILFASFLVSIIGITILQPFASFCLEKQSNLERKYLSNKNRNMISVVDSGIYIFESLPDKNRILTARSAIKQKNMLQQLTILEFDKEYNFKSRIDASDAEFIDKTIKLGNIASRLFIDGEKENLAGVILESSLSFSVIMKKFESPENISFWNLESLSTNLANSGIQADKFINYYYKLLFRPIYGIAIILLASCFITLNTRGKSTIKVIGYGSMVGLAIHASREIGSAFLISQSFSAPFAQAIPILVIISISTIILIQKFEL